MLVVFLITGVFILLGILYIFHLKREIRRIIEWIEHNEHIYSVNVFDKDIEILRTLHLVSTSELKKMNEKNIS